METFVVRDGKVVLFAPTPKGFFATGLISLGSKLGLFLEPFKGKSKGPDRSLYDFCVHRFGQEVRAEGRRASDESDRHDPR